MKLEFVTNRGIGCRTRVGLTRLVFGRHGVACGALDLDLLLERDVESSEEDFLACVCLHCFRREVLYHHLDGKTCVSHASHWYEVLYRASQSVTKHTIVSGRMKVACSMY